MAEIVTMAASGPLLIDYKPCSRRQPFGKKQSFLGRSGNLGCYCAEQIHVCHTTRSPPFCSKSFGGGLPLVSLTRFVPLGQNLLRAIRDLNLASYRAPSMARQLRSRQGMEGPGNKESAALRQQDMQRVE
jgi:hypothetical protein